MNSASRAEAEADASRLPPPSGGGDEARHHRLKAVANHSQRPTYHARRGNHDTWPTEAMAKQRHYGLAGIVVGAGLARRAGPVSR